MKKIFSFGILGLALLSQVLLGVNSYYGVVTATTAGTAYQVAPNVTPAYTALACLQITITADPGNSGTLYIGMSSSVSSTNYFAALPAKGSWNSGPTGSIPNFPCQDVYITGSVNSTKADVIILPGVISQ